MSNKITTTIKCKNLAPIKNLNYTISSSSLRFAIFADNGSGKTYMSRMFRLLEDQKLKNIDRMIKLGENEASFSFCIKDESGNKKEDIDLKLKMSENFSYVNTYYIYHTFNEDYIENNIRLFKYEKNGEEISGYILGKVNIDIKDDEANLLKLLEEGKNERKNIESSIEEYIKTNLNIRDINRLTDFELLKYEKISEGVLDETKLFNLNKKFDDILAQHHKFKAIPENLSDIKNELIMDNQDLFLEEVNSFLKKEYTLSSLAEDFKSKVKEKQGFIEEGLSLINEDTKNKSCPFCEEPFNNNSLQIIEKYLSFIKDEEARTIKKLNEYKIGISDVKNKFSQINNKNAETIALFNEYKEKYIHVEQVLKRVDVEKLIKDIDSITAIIDEKIKDITKPKAIEEILTIDIKDGIKEINLIIEENNKSIDIWNKRKHNLADTSKDTRRELCKVSYDILVREHSSKIIYINQLRDTYNNLKIELDKKKEETRIEKRKKVFTTIEHFLRLFFGQKYSIDEETFSISFNGGILNKNQLKDVLSEGEKNIIAFIYYLSDLHLKIDKIEDYQRLFLIIDDPISSMDFLHVYTLSGVIRDMKNHIPEIEKPKFFIFTHNSEFMRLIVSNNIVDKKLILKDGSLKDFNNNSTVPYVNHLIDLYQISIGNKTPTHTTANSIRHLLETLDKFEKIEFGQNGIDDYIRVNFEKNPTSYTLINDLSHGGFRDGQKPISDDQYKSICIDIINHIENKYPSQIEYCKKAKVN